MNTDKREILRCWLALGMVKGVGRKNYKTLLELFGSPPQVFESVRKGEAGGMSGPIFRSIRNFREWDYVDEEISKAEAYGARIITLRDDEYPALLKSIYDAPPYIYAKGDLGLLRPGSKVAVVGARYPTHYGKRMSEEIACDLASSGVVVVSGMARGCDSIAHAGALSVGGETIAVLGTGIDVPYPRENRRLYERILENGLILSELPCGTTPHAANFPQRNRIISGLSLGVTVVEAAPKSGSLITARCALESGREVFALPGNVTSMKSRGTNNLIKEGAILVEGARDILESLSLSGVAFTCRAGMEEGGLMAPAGKEILIHKVLQDDVLNVGEIVDRTELAAQDVLCTLLDMELKGMVKQYPGKCYAAVGQQPGCR